MTTIRVTGNGIVKNDVLKRVQKELIYHIRNLNMEDIENTRELFNSYFNFLSSMSILPDAVLPKQKKVNPVEKLSESEVVAEPVVEVPRYRFEQKLRGGVFQTLDGGYLISERNMRETGLKHNDVCIIKDNSKPPYVFEVVEPGDGKPAQREQFNLCLVQWSRGAYRISSTYNNEPLMFGGEECDFKISEKDVLDYNLNDGDIVDIAFYSNNADTMKIIFVHNTQNSETKRTVAKRSASKRAATKPKEEESEERALPVDYELFKDKTVVLVGSQSSGLNYQRAFAKLDGVTLVHFTGDERSTRIESAVKKADVVICPTEHVGHGGSTNARELAKKHNKPYVQTDRDGAQHIIVEAEKVLKSYEAVPT